MGKHLFKVMLPLITITLIAFTWLKLFAPQGNDAILLSISIGVALIAYVLYEMMFSKRI